MTKQEFMQLAEKQLLILDGATGSNLQMNGMSASICPEQWILEHPEIIIKLQEDYLAAGTDILYSPTFTGNRIKLSEYGLEDKVKEINTALVEMSKEAIRRYRNHIEKPCRPCFIAGDLTMTGRQLAPVGTLVFEDLIDAYKEQILALTDAGVDLIVVETMMSLQECRAALIAAKEVCDLPVMVAMTFQEDGRTFYGTDPATAVTVLQSLGASAVGINCSTGPEKIAELLDIMRPYATVPLIAKPNAGLPILKGTVTSYDMEPDQFAQEARLLIEAGAGILGGCCGTTPEHIRKLKMMAESMPVPKVSVQRKRLLATERKTLEIGLNSRFYLIGERINPTGKKDLQAQLKEGNLELAVQMAQEQEELGADILDINMGMNGIDEKEMMQKAIEEVSMQANLPLCIDSSHIDVIELALRNYPGRALINSISLEHEKYERLLPAAAKYGAMFILLPLSDAGLPKDMEEKKQIIMKITSQAEALGMYREDIIVDALVNTIGANKDAAIQAIDTIRYCKENSLATVCGLSNISFGLPQRQYVNATFLAFALQAGLTMAIANPSQELLVSTAYAADLLLAREDSDVRYISQVTKPVPATAPLQSAIKPATQPAEEKAASAGAGEVFVEEVYFALFDAVVKGKRKTIVSLVEEELRKGHTAQALLNSALIPAINVVGEYFEKKKYFLPQLISSAEAMKSAVERLEPLLAADSGATVAGTIVIATVAGDIHDIGKNLVGLMLKNYGFRIIDLGKDVPSDLIVRTAKEENADIIALSALMTTTMLEMKEVIRLRNESGIQAKVMIGGAVITQGYCDEIGADGYSKDAKEAVEVARLLIGKH